MEILNTQLGLLHNVPHFVTNETEITSSMVGDFIFRHRTFQGRYTLLSNYYMGKHAILNRTMGIEKPNNKTVENFAEFITDMKAGYFMGKPISYKMKGKKLNEELQVILDNNDEQDVNSDHAIWASIYGHSFELLWLNTDGEVRFKPVRPTEMIMVYGTDIDETPVCAIRYFTVALDGTTTDTLTIAEVYTKDSITYYEGEDESRLRFIKEIPHLFNAVPVVEFKNNNEKLGDFENVISMIDAYELVTSDSINEVQYFNDAYLVLYNMLETDNDDIANMKNNRVISLDENGKAEWLTKNINDTHVENILNRLKNDIHKFSKTPSLTDEKFASNLSGVAIRFKLWGLEQDTGNKERKFKKGLQKRFKLISGIKGIETGKPFNFRDIKMTFMRNIPSNLLEQIQTVSTLNGIVSLETLLAQLPFVENVGEELEKIEKELEAQATATGFEPLPTDVDDEDPVATKTE